MGEHAGPQPCHTPQNGDELNMEKGIFAGLSIVADCIDFRNPNIIPMVLTGYFDDQLLYSFFWVSHHKYPTSPEEYKTDERSNYALNSLKEIIRNKLEHFLWQLEREEELKKQANLEQIRSELRKSSKPHDMGTVAEIAQKYNISKSEVRRRKVEGSLYELAK